MRERTCAPNPNLFESMRCVGYDLNTAIADIVDNSISANSRHISIQYFDQNEKPYLAIIDDGNGMDENAALDAMQLAGNSPSDKRTSNDLGRFGLGLKTASLSQARSLLIVTRQKSIQTALRWDLDSIAHTGEWTLEQLDEQETAAELPQKVQNAMTPAHGTCVLWRHLDKLETLSGSSLKDLDKLMLELTNYLALVFHRFVCPYPYDDVHQISIDINGYSIPRRDPFLINNPATQTTPVQRIGTSGATLRGYTLPYQNRLSDNDKQLLNLSDERGRTLVDTQGFYIYRAHRLITWGSWFRMLPKKQATKLSRVQVDIPNNLDSEWTIDIKKSKAAPPKIISKVMKRYVELLAKPSRRAQQFRGRKKSDDPEAPVWNILNDREGDFHYEINKKNPCIATFISELTPEQRKAFSKIIEVLSSTIPYEDMQSRFAIDERPVKTEFTDSEAREFAQQMWSLNKIAQLSPQQFINRFKAVEPMSLCKNGEKILKEIAHDE